MDVITLAVAVAAATIGYVFGQIVTRTWKDRRIEELENALRVAENRCRTSKGYPTLQSELVAEVMRLVKVSTYGR
jgi:hypothetical protein